MKRRFKHSIWALSALLFAAIQIIGFIQPSRAHAITSSTDIRDATGRYSAYNAFRSCVVEARPGDPISGAGLTGKSEKIVAGYIAEPENGMVTCGQAFSLWYDAMGFGSYEEVADSFGFAIGNGSGANDGCIVSQTQGGTCTDLIFPRSFNKTAALSRLKSMSEAKDIPTTEPAGGGYWLGYEALMNGCSGSSLSDASAGASSGTKIALLADETGTISYKSTTSTSSSLSNGTDLMKTPDYNNVRLGAYPRGTGLNRDKDSCVGVINLLNSSQGTAEISALLIKQNREGTVTDFAKAFCDKTGNPASSCVPLVTKVTTQCIDSYVASQTAATASHGGAALGSTFDSQVVAACILNKLKGSGLKNLPTKAEVAAMLDAAQQNNTPIATQNSKTDDDPCAILPANTSLRWLACSALTIGAGLAKAFYGIAQGLLYTPVDSIFNNSGFKNVMSTFRIIGLALIIIAGLVMVIAQATGTNFVDAYTVKKVLPKLGIALVGIALASPLLRMLIGFVNDIGILGGDFLVALSQNDPSASNKTVGDFIAIFTTGTIATAGTLAAMAVFLGAAGFLSLIGTVVLALAIGVAVLAFRQLVIVLLILLAPLAIAAYVLPGTEKLWKFWKNTLLTTLMMFPIIMMFLASGRFMASIFGKMGSSGDNTNLYAAMAVLVYFAPYFLLPFAFKLAGGFMSTIFQIANDRSKGGFDRLRNYRQNRVKQNTADWRGGNRFKGNNILGRGLNSTGRTFDAFATGEMGYAPTKWGQRLGSANSRYGLDEARKAMQENRYLKSILPNDDYTTAALNNWMDEDGQRKALRATGMYDERTIDEAIGSIRMAQRSMSRDAFENAALLGLPSTGTAWKQKFDKDGNVISGGAGDMRAAINRVAKGDRNRAATLLASMRGAAEQAGRADLAGGSFGEDLGIMDAMYRNEVAVAQGQAASPITYTNSAGQTVSVEGTNNAISQIYNRRALETKGAGQLIGTLRAHGFQGIATAMRQDLEEASKGVLAADGMLDIKSDDVHTIEFARELGVHAGMLDAAGQVSPEKQRIVADTVFGKTVRVDGVETTYGKLLDTLRSDPRYVQIIGETRREYSTRYQQDAANAAAEATSQQQQQQQQQQPQ